MNGGVLAFLCLLGLTIYRGFVYRPLGLDAYFLYLPGFCFLPILFGLFWFTRRPSKRHLLLWTLSVIVFLGWIWPFRYNFGNVEKSGIGVVTVNFDGYDINIAEAAKRLNALQPDFICFQELWARHQLSELRGHLPGYEFIHHSVEDSEAHFFNYGTFIATRLDWKVKRVDSPASTVGVMANKEDKALLVFSLHGRKVHGYGPTAVLTTAEWQFSQMRELEAVYGDKQLPVLVGGDFNAPASGPGFKVTSLRHAFDQAGRGFGGTYPASAPFFRIDHILASEKVDFQSLETFDAGSDHLGLLARFGLSP